MFFRSLVFLAFIVLSATNGEVLRRRRSVPYQGPFAPLNEDGTVALTPEVQQARAAHDAAIAAEFMRLEEAKRLAAAHPDLTSPPDHGWTQHDEYNSPKQGYQSAFSVSSGYEPKVQYSHGSSTSHNQNMLTSLDMDRTFALNSELQQAKAAYEAALKRLMEVQSLSMANPDLTSQMAHSDQGLSHPPVHSKNPEAGMPAPLNPDGTVAQTAAYKAIAASLAAEYEKVLQNIKHQNVNQHFQNKATQGYTY